MKLERKLPVRVSLVGVAVICYLGTPILCQICHLEEHVETVYTALMALYGLVTAAVAGDTYRPSGHMHAPEALEVAGDDA